mmetsp:Transcript_23553/g.52213  ORF Transcript_23553/g.52213 Transcript_23553/m.52213 type:complete len:546 (+) Transcript_23553:1000-2637(+)
MRKKYTSVPITMKQKHPIKQLTKTKSFPALPCSSCISSWQQQTNTKLVHNQQAQHRRINNRKMKSGLGDQLRGGAIGNRNRKNNNGLVLGMVLLLSIAGVTEAFVATKNCGNHGIVCLEAQRDGSDAIRTEPDTAVLSRRSAWMTAAKSASAAFVALSIDPSRSSAEAATQTITPIKAAWKSVDGLNTMEEEKKNFVGFDARAYQAMISDQSRTPLFYKAMEERINNGEGASTVLDLGTGPFAIFAIKAAELGAKKVYAIEANKEAAETARETIAKKGYDDIITVLEGFSTDITLPNDDKVDLVVAEIIGSIASEEGVVATIADAHKRFAKNPTSAKSWIPTRAQTYAAPASYTLHNMFGPPGFDWSKLDGEPVRFSCRDEGLQLLADPQVVEDIVFADILNYNSKKNGKTLKFEVDETRTKDNTVKLVKELQANSLGKSEATRMADATGNSFSGLAFWPRLILSENDTGDDSITINSREYPKGGHQRSHWQTVLPIMNDVPVPVKGGDMIQVAMDFDVPSGAAGTGDITTPASYKLDGTVTSSA